MASIEEELAISRRAAEEITTPHEATAPSTVDVDEIKTRQRYAESSFNDSAVSPSGAKGAFQIMPVTHEEYVKRTGDEGDLLDAAYNEKVRDYTYDRLYNSFTASTGNPSEQVRVAKTLAMYNRGRTAVADWLAEQKRSGVDIYNSLDWIESMPWKETRDYVNFILLGKDVNDSQKNQALYIKAKEKYLNSQKK